MHNFTIFYEPEGDQESVFRCETAEAALRVYQGLIARHARGVVVIDREGIVLDEAALCRARDSDVDVSPTSSGPKRH